MSKYNFKVNIRPEEALKLVKENQYAELIHEEILDLGNGSIVGILVFEKYYFRAGNRAALTVIIDNIQEETEVRSVATGSSQGLFFKFDWGAADDFACSVRDVLEEYIID
jgi:hypothetical protein